MTATLVPAPSRRVAAGARAVVLACLMFVVVGITLAPLVLTAPGEPARALPEGPFSVAQDIAVSFGTIAVEHAEALPGLTSKDLNGATHGIAGFVGNKDALTQATMTLRNSTDKPLDFDRRQFTVVTTPEKGKPRTLQVLHATVNNGTLQPDAAVDVRFSFRVPRDRSALALHFDDPGQKDPVVIDLGITSGKKPAQIDEGHAPATAGGAAQTNGNGHGH